MNIHDSDDRVSPMVSTGMIAPDISLPNYDHNLLENLLSLVDRLFMEEKLGCLEKIGRPTFVGKCINQKVALEQGIYGVSIGIVVEIRPPLILDIDPFTDWLQSQKDVSKVTQHADSCAVFESQSTRAFFYVYCISYPPLSFSDSDSEWFVLCHEDISWEEYPTRVFRAARLWMERTPKAVAVHVSADPDNSQVEILMRNPVFVPLDFERFSVTHYRDICVRVLDADSCSPSSFY